MCVLFLFSLSLSLSFSLAREVRDDESSSVTSHASKKYSRSYLLECVIFRVLKIVRKTPILLSDEKNTRALLLLLLLLLKEEDEEDKEEEEGEYEYYR